MDRVEEGLLKRDAARTRSTRTRATRSPEALACRLATDRTLREAVSRVASGARADLEGVDEAACGLLVACALRLLPGRLLAVVPDERLAASLVEEMAAWAPGETVERLLAPDPGEAPGLPLGWERAARARLVVAGPRAVAEGVPDPEALHASSKRLRAGDRADPGALLA
ncbi:MAG: hypothetical protein HY608_00800, partial [Planctomycetes bacterium]|nr:hypothetical protein [Planctomycetota bacterium]